MKCTIAITRSAIAHQENAKKRNDAMVKSHYNTHFPRRTWPNVRQSTWAKKQGVREDAFDRVADYCPVLTPHGTPNVDYSFFPGALVAAGGGASVIKLSFTAAGSLSAFASNRLTCHLSVVERVFSNPGIPVMRIPPETFQ